MSRYRTCPICRGRLLYVRGIGGTIVVCSRGCDRTAILAALDSGQLKLGEAS